MSVSRGRCRPASEGQRVSATAHLFVPTPSGGKDPSRERIDLGLVSLDVQLWKLFLCKPMSTVRILRGSVARAIGPL